MKRLVPFIPLVCFGLWGLAESSMRSVPAENIADLPMAVSNNAVTTVDVEDHHCYDVSIDAWDQATLIPGKSVFGHAGGIAGNRIVYCDGVGVRTFVDQPRDFDVNDDCFLGIIAESDSRRIDWRRISPYPGLPRYRMAAAGIPSLNAVVFVGGSENPYNYTGIDYDGEPSEPVGSALLFDLDSLTWRELSLSGPATMDHRGLVPFGNRWLTVGGMLAGQEVSNHVIAYKFESERK